MFDIRPIARAERAIASCKTSGQMETAMKYTELAFKASTNGCGNNKDWIVLHREEFDELFEILSGCAELAVNQSKRFQHVVTRYKEIQLVYERR